jgi:hypothetical protein
MAPVPDQALGQTDVLDRQIAAKLFLAHVKPKHVQKLGSPEQRGGPLRILLTDTGCLLGKLAPPIVR